MLDQIRNPKSEIRNLVECVPNFSEGRKVETGTRIARAIESVPGVTVLNRHIDPDHNRSVITLVAAPVFIVEAALRSVARPAAWIDLTRRQGVQPPLGAS